MMEEVLAVRSLSKRFKDLIAVDSVSFALKRGEILGLLGPNGAGKTTTFQMLLGVLTPTSGTIEYFGQNFIDSRESILERINFCSTYTNLPWNLSIRESFAFIIRLYRIKNRKHKLDEIIETFDLGDLMEKDAVTLSAGEITRVNMAKAFLNDPEVVLLDEPTASLDPENAHFVRDYILKKQRDQNLSIVFTSHNMAEVESICDRVIFIQKGCVVADGIPTDLARTLDKCEVSFVFRIENLEAAKAVAAGLGIEGRVCDREFIASMSEHAVAAYLNSLSSAGVVLSALNVRSSSLEDYFMFQSNQGGD